MGGETGSNYVPSCREQAPADISIQIENDELSTKKWTFLSNRSVGKGGSPYRT